MSLFNIFKKSPDTKKSPLNKAFSRRVTAVSVLLILTIIAMIGVFSYISILRQHDQQYLSLVYDQQVVSQQIATFSLEAANGNSSSFIQLKRYEDRFIQNLQKLDQGDIEVGLPPLPTILRVDLETLEEFWDDYQINIETVMSSRTAIETVNDYVLQINESIPELLTLSDNIINLIIDSKSGRKEIAVAARQLALIQSIQNSLNQIVSGGDAVMTAADSFAREVELVEQFLIAMLDGSQKLGIKQFSGDEIVSHLLQIADLFSIVKKNATQILENSPELFEVRDAAVDMQLISPKLLTAARDLEKSIILYDERLQIMTFAGYALGVAAIGMMFLIGYFFYRASQLRLRESNEQNEKNQNAILKLLDEMSSLADGDLSSYTTVTEDITGAIADSVNYSIDALRDLVVTINQTAVQITSTVNKTRTVTMALSDDSHSQANEIQTASDSVNQVSQSVNDVAAEAEESAEIARKSVTMAHEGSSSVKLTIDGMENIREQIQETSKRIKRLGESSQEIGDIVGLITEISDQTNILALNAAIQASMAGEAGRGFAVVADEVQRLAERTGDATKQISALVKTIQTDTNEAISSMEQSTTNVVEGANLAENAGQALQNIENVSLQLASKILTISDKSKEHASSTDEVSGIMMDIKNITHKTLDGTVETSQAIDDLAKLVKALQKSVAGFKLPGIGLEESMVISPEDTAKLQQSSEVMETEQA